MLCAKKPGITLIYRPNVNGNGLRPVCG